MSYNFFFAFHSGIFQFFVVVWELNQYKRIYILPDALPLLQHRLTPVDSQIEQKCVVVLGGVLIEVVLGLRYDFFLDKTLCHNVLTVYFYVTRQIVGDFACVGNFFGRCAHLYDYFWIERIDYIAERARCYVFVALVDYHHNAAVFGVSLFGDVFKIKPLLFLQIVVFGTAEHTVGGLLGDKFLPIEKHYVVFLQYTLAKILYSKQLIADVREIIFVELILALHCQIVGKRNPHECNILLKIRLIVQLIHKIAHHKRLAATGGRLKNELAAVDAVLPQLFECFHKLVDGLLLKFFGCIFWHNFLSINRLVNIENWFWDRLNRNPFEALKLVFKLCTVAPTEEISGYPYPSVFVAESFEFLCKSLNFRKSARKINSCVTLFAVREYLERI